MSHITLYVVQYLLLNPMSNFKSHLTH